mgnify:CR=1 FL=1
MSALLALLGAASFGAGDFLGGLASRRVSWIVVATTSQFVGLLVIIAAALLISGPASGSFSWLGSASGLGFAVGVALLYKALADGEMARVAPITSLLAILVPVGIAVYVGQPAGLLLGSGIAAAVIAIILISQETSQAADPRNTLSSATLCIAILAGLGFAVFYIGLDGLPHGRANLWPLVGVRAIATLCTGTVLGLSLARGQGQIQRPPAFAAGAGLLDGTATIILFAALGSGSLTIVATIGSLYPAATILLALTLLGERLSGRQIAGLLFAAAAVIMIAVADVNNQ